MYRRRPVEAALPRERRVTRLKLNIFQRLTRQWDALHPYNAAQAMRIAGDVDDLEAATKLAQTLAELQVGWATLTGRHYVPSAPPGAGDVPLEIMPDGMSLDVHISNELNRPFAVDGGPTLRPFLVRDVGSYWLGVIYHHWAADSASIRALLREWFLRLYEPERARRTAFVPARLGYLRAVGPRSAGWDAVGGLLDAARWSSRFKSVRRLDRSLMDQIAGSGVATHFSRHELPDGLVRLLRAAAKQRDATLNDLFLAVLAYAVDKYVVEQPRFRRHALALGTIVDLRPRSATLKGLDAAEAFGLYLGFTNVVVRPQDLADIERLSARDGTLAHGRGRGGRHDHARRIAPGVLSQAIAPGRGHLQRQHGQDMGGRSSSRADTGLRARLAGGADAAAGDHPHHFGQPAAFWHDLPRIDPRPGRSRRGGGTDPSTIAWLSCRAAQSPPALSEQRESKGQPHPNRAPPPLSSPSPCTQGEGRGEGYSIRDP
jgi:hypothetical protein